jgi:hypothetical protein
MTNTIALTDSGLTLVPETTVAEGCPVLTKLRHISVRKGVTGTVLWQLRGPNGEIIDLTGVLCPETSESVTPPSSESPTSPSSESQSFSSQSHSQSFSSYSTSFSVPSSHSQSFSSYSETSESVSPCVGGKVVARIVSCDEQMPITEVAASIVDAATGQVSFVLPSAITAIAGIYRLELGVLNSARKLIFSDQGLLSVERGQFGNTLDMSGPPTLTEIRMALRDSQVENNLLDSYEFSADEVIFSVIRPVMEWNETPPDVRRFNCHTFPWRELWLKGIISYLLQTAVFHYTRNKLNASHGGLTVADKEKDREYQALASLFRDEWLRGLRAKKVEINIGLVYRSLGSGYAYPGGW